jgi:meso-butanediol dehydrogenase/(S,S)-butanediol dehydrogenase/diacetyl reductase
VALFDRDGEALAAAAAELGGDVLTRQFDVTDRDAIDAALATTRAQLGPIAVLVPAAGIDDCDTVPDTTFAQWDRLLEVDLTSVFALARGAIAQMREAGGGAIVTISSAIGTVGHQRRSAYCAAKAGVENLTRAIALDHGREGIRANCVAPGLIDTPLIAGGKVGGDLGAQAAQEMVDRYHAIPRMGRPEEVANAIAFLASEEASFITGAVLAVDAGWNAG